MDYLDRIRVLRDQGVPFVLATVVRVEKPTSAKPGAKAIITADGALSGWIGGSCAEPTVKREAIRALHEGNPHLLRLCPAEKMGLEPQEGVIELTLTCMSGGTLEIYLEPYLTQPRLVVIGHQAIAETLAQMARALEYPVVVAGVGVSPERFPSATRVISGIDFSALELTPHTYVIVASHGNYDEPALEAVLPSPAPYVALVASKKRLAAVQEYLRQAGLPEEQIDRLKCPAGLDFGAATPPEIALSILAEIVQHHRRNLGIGPVEQVANVGAQSNYAPTTAIDPVCGMTVEVASALYTADYHGKTYYFCAPSCQHKFQHSPEAYLEKIS